MGYDLHVVRTLDWVDAPLHPLTFADVDALVQADPQLRWAHIASAEVGDPPVTITTKGNFIEWKGTLRFWYWEDAIICKNPGDPEVLKLLAMAKALGAYVVGDDGEQYKLHRSIFGRESIRIIKPV
jgi:hypothetical protein